MLTIALCWLGLNILFVTVLAGLARGRVRNQRGKGSHNDCADDRPDGDVIQIPVHSIGVSRD